MLTVEIPYTAETDEKLVNETFGPNNIRRRKTGAQDMRLMPIVDGRNATEELTLERNGFVLVEHKTDLLARVAERVLVLDAGRTVGDGPAREVLADPRLRELGIAEPSSDRLRRRLQEVGVDPVTLGAA